MLILTLELTDVLIFKGETDLDFYISIWNIVYKKQL